ncbi:MAG TPA: hypothetical protein VKR06_17590 [Ktedonosporobacter sp.]|nr:hypothetical protein [Ktedonosporobacter sp.]
MGETVSSSDASQQNTSCGLLQELGSVPGEGVGTGEQQTNQGSVVQWNRKVV